MIAITKTKRQKELSKLRRKGVLPNVCKKCGKEMEYDGSGYDIKRNENHKWWFCPKCKNMEYEIINL